MAPEAADGFFNPAAPCCKPRQAPVSPTRKPMSTSAGGESFAALFEESLKRSEMRVGEVITAEVVRIDYNFVVVNAGLRVRSLHSPSTSSRTTRANSKVQVGDFVSVAIDAVENGYGDTILSRDKAKRLASWMSLEKAQLDPANSSAARSAARSRAA